MNAYYHSLIEEIKKEILCEIEPFKENGYEFLNKNMSKMDFRSISCGFGVYAQRNQKDFVIRLRTSSGVIALDQLKKIYEWANKYEVEYLHFYKRCWRKLSKKCSTISFIWSR